MFKHILTPTDGSIHATRALDKAIELQKLTGAALTVLTVYRHHSMLEASFSMVRPGDPGNMDDIMRGHAREVAEAAKAYALEHGATEPHAIVRNGPVARGVIAVAKEHGCDLIIMGSRGLGSIEGYLLGSVSHKVTGAASCPVMVV